MAQAIRAYVQSAGGKVTSDQIKAHIQTEYPGQWKESTVQAHLYAGVVNSPKAYIYHPYADRFLYRNTDGTFELYSESEHGENVWQPFGDDDGATDVGELAEASIGLERDLEAHLAQNLDAVEKGLRLTGRQVNTDVGRIDLLAEDAEGNRVVIEIKVGEGKDAAVGQIARYMGWYAKAEGKPPRGMLIAADFEDRIRCAAAAVPNLSLFAYRVQFSFEQIAE